MIFDGGDVGTGAVPTDALIIYGPGHFLSTVFSASPLAEDIF
jgi:hypothetical protein